MTPNDAPAPMPNIALCRFCGNTFYLIVGGGSAMGMTLYHVHCQGCHAAGPRAETPEGAIERWNKGMMEPPPRGEGE